MARESIWEYQRRKSSPESREQMRRIMEANENPGRTMGQMIWAIATNGGGLRKIETPEEAAEYVFTAAMGGPKGFRLSSGSKGRILAMGKKVAAAERRLDKAEANLASLERTRRSAPADKFSPPSEHVVRQTVYQKLPTSEQAVGYSASSVNSDVMAANARIDKLRLASQEAYTRYAGRAAAEAAYAEAAPGAKAAVAEARARFAGARKLRDATAELAEYTDRLAAAYKVPTPVKKASEPGWLRRAIGWVGQKVAAPQLALTRLSQWKAHPVKNVMTVAADVGIPYLGYAIYQNRKAAKAQLESDAKQASEAVQARVDKLSGEFRAIDPALVADDVGKDDFGSFNKALGTLKAAVYTATDPMYGSATNKVDVADAEDLARAMPKGAWYQYASALYDRMSASERRKSGFDLTDEDAAVDYGINDFLERSKYRKEAAR